MQHKILAGIPPKNHINLAMDEVQGLSDLGYSCETSTYSKNNPGLNKLSKLWGVLTNAFIIVRKLYAFRPDILYLNSRFGVAGCTRDFITVLIVRVAYPKKLAVSIKTHGSDLEILESNSFLLHRLVLNYLSEQVDAWFFLSQEEKQAIVKNVPELGKKIHVTNNIIDPRRSVESTDFKQKFGLDDGRFTFFFAGRMVRQKGIFSIVKAIPLFTHREDCLFVMTGDGEDYEELVATIDELNLRPYVKLTGFVPDELCDHFYANTDALVFPTYFNEGFPMALFKAVASGMPIITTRTRAAKDHLREPDNCLWVDGQSERSVAEALNTMYKDQNLQKAMKKNNILLGQNFTREAICKEMHEVFQSVL